MNMNELQEIINTENGYTIHFWNKTPMQSFPPHWHDFMEIVAPLHDNYNVTINGHTYILNATDIIFIFPGEIHSFEETQPYCSLGVQFPYTVLTSFRNFKEHIHLFNQIRVISPNTYPGSCPQLIDTLQTMEDTCFGNAIFSELLTYTKLFEFFALVGTTYLEQPKDLDGIASSQISEYNEKFYDICNYITNNCTAPLSLDDIAQYAGFSKYHFSRLFKQFTHMTFNDYVQAQKIKKAESLLASPALTITEVAFQSGFNSLSTFNRVFKLTKGCTPKEYKALYNASHIAQ
ncbi:MAG: AraC family transcriptional regulator [Eubacteriales bacterium]